MTPLRLFLGLALLAMAAWSSITWLEKAPRGQKEAALPAAPKEIPAPVAPAAAPPGTPAPPPRAPAGGMLGPLPTLAVLQAPAATSPLFTSQEVTLVNPPRTVDFTVFRKEDQGTHVRGIALSGDGKVLTLAHLFADAQYVLLAGDPTHTACLGWLARDPEHDGLVVKLRGQDCSPARVVAPSYLVLTAGDPLFLPLPHADAPQRGLTAAVAAAPEGAPPDPAGSGLWIAASPEELLPGTPVLDRHRYLIGLIDEIRPDLHLAHVKEVSAPMEILDRAARRGEIADWKEQEETSPYPFKDPSISPDKVQSLQTLQGTAWEQACEQLLREHGASSLAWYEAVLGYRRDGKPEQALASARMLTQLAPKEGEGWVLLGQELDAKKDYAGAIDAYQNAIENGARKAETAVPLAAALFHSGDSRRGLDQLSSLCEEEPEAYEAWLALGDARQASGLYPEAVGAYLHVLGLDPQSVHAWTSLAALHDQLGEQQDAVESYKQLLLLTPQDPEAWRHFGQLQAKDHPSDARRSLHNAILLDPRDRDTWIELAALATQEGDFDEADQDAKKALEIDPRSGQAWRQLGVAELNQNQSDQAETAWNHAVEINPGDIESWRDLAQLQYRHGGLQGAAPALAQLEKLAPAEVASLKAAWNQEGVAATPLQLGE